jgi:hypothetical protein
MSTSVVAFRPSRSLRLLDPAQANERSIRRRVGITWGLLLLNTLQYTGAIVHIPSAIGKAITQGALCLAVLLALSVNRRVIIRPNVFLCIVTLLPIEAIITTLQPQHFGTIYRCFRLIEFVAVLWLLTPWWGRRDLMLVRYHITSLAVVLGTVVLGALVAPGHAFDQGRLGGALWQIPPTQVAHYAAIVTGIVALFWLSGHMRGRPALIVVAVTGSILLLTHTRTALVAMLAGLLVSGLSLITARARVRKLFAAAGAAAAVVIMTLSGFITTWLARGQGTDQLTKLTGRTTVWGPLLAFPRNKFQEIFGFGLSNGSFNGFSIDSNWLASYQQQGLFGVGVCAAMVLFLLVVAYFQPRGTRRALALFLVTYCLIASFTEDAFTDATPYLLEMTLAASLLVPYAASRKSL